MKTVADRNLSKLSPSFGKKVAAFLAEVQKTLGNVIFISEGWRSPERQAELLKAGLSQVKHSNHQDGLAIDIAFNGSELYPTDMNRWRQIADIAKKYQIDWGYDLWRWDKPHFQDNGLPLDILAINQVKTMPHTQYTEIMNNELKKSGMPPIFTSHEGDQPVTEQVVKELIEIACVRLYSRMCTKK